MSNWLTDYLSYASSSETPLKMLHWVGISTVAGALRRNVWLDQGRYMLYPNFYVVLVARPGVVQKTTTINYGIKLLRNLPHIKFAPTNVTWEGFINYLDQQHSSSHGQLSLDAEIVRTASLTIVSGEMSVFYDPEAKGMISAMTDLWDCPDMFEKVTKFSGSEFIDNPCINWVAGTTPSFMREAFDRFSREGGLASRIIFVHATHKRQFVAHPQKAPKDVVNKLVMGLDRISHMHGEIKMTAEARARSEEWYNEHCRAMEDAGVLASTGFKDRKQTHILKLALILSCVKRGDYRLTLDDLNEAIEHINEVEGDFLAAFESLDDRPELRPYKELKGFMEANKQISKTALMARFTGKFTLVELMRALDALVVDGSIGSGAGLAGVYYVWKGQPPLEPTK